MSVIDSLVLIRHGQSLANVAFLEADARGALVADGVGDQDGEVPLTEVGEAQARAVGAWLAAHPEARPEVVITSPYLRARETWRLAAAESGLDLPGPTTDDRLVDRLTGELEMLTRATIAARFPDEPGRLAEAGEYFYRPPGGETFADVADRLRSFLTDLNREHAGRRVVVVAHDAVVLMARMVVEGLDWDGIGAVQQAGRVLNASITRFDGSSGRLVLADWNAVGHLP